MAADRILVRGYGRPLQLTVADAGRFRDIADLSDTELMQIICGGPALTLEALPVPGPEPVELPTLDPERLEDASERVASR